MNAYTSWLAWLSVGLGIMSAIKAIARLLNVGFIGVHRDIMAVYSRMTAPLHELVTALELPFALPPMAIDLCLLYLVLLATSVRSAVLPLGNEEYMDHERHYKLERSIVWAPHSVATDALIEQFETKTDRSLLSIETLSDESLRIAVVHIQTKKSALLKAFLRSILLLPVLTLEPWRRIRISKRLAFFPPKLNDKKTFNEIEGFGAIKTDYFRVQNLLAQSVLQIIAMPVAILGFLVTATYVPVGE